VTAALLDGLRVVDLCGDLAEAAGRVLADLGAVVIKVEPPEGGQSRRRGPLADDGTSYYWKVWGRGKRSVVFDLAAPSGVEQLHRLLVQADVLLESATSSQRLSWGIVPEQVAVRYPQLIHASITAFGIDGPLADAPASDLTLSAAGGLLNHQGDKDRPPIPIGFPETAHHGAVQAAADVMVALYERDRSGLGQHLDTSMQAAVVGTLLWTSSYAALDRNPSFTGDDRSQASRDRGGEVVAGIRNPVVEPCADGHVVMTFVLGAQGNAAFAAAMRWVEEAGALDADLCGREWVDWIEEMKSGVLPVEDGRRAMDQLLAFIKTRTKAEIHQRSVSDKMLIAPCNNAADLLADPQLRARGFWVDVDGMAIPGPFAVLSETPIRYDRGAPALGADQDEVETWIPAAPAGGSAAPTVPAVAARPLEGVKVVDLTWMAAGPIITRELANHGATVVHIETMAHVDTMRWLPPFHGEQVGTDTGLPAANVNQSKLGLACNFGRPEAVAVIDRLIDWADVVVENFRPGLAARYGFGWDHVQARNPRAVMLSTSMRGQTGPEATLTGFGLHGAALAGFVDITGWADRAPIAPWGAYTDFVSPRFALAALLAALRRAAKTGQGQYIDVSQNETGVHHLGPLIAEYSQRGSLLVRPGVSSEAGAPSGVFGGAGSERYLTVSVLGTPAWDAMVSVVEPMRRFAGLSAPERLEQRREIETVFAEWLSVRDVFVVQQDLLAAGCPAYVSMRATDLHRDPQLAYRHFFTPLEHQVIDAAFDGPVSILSRTPAQAWRAGPTIGEHSQQVLADLLGFSDQEIADLAVAGVLT
jgi:crotonobetainyl-CoA:carnitine CoA-transferase CaiB-like acyl-CoA transferase